MNSVWFLFITTVSLIHSSEPFLDPLAGVGIAVVGGILTLYRNEVKKEVSVIGKTIGRKLGYLEGCEDHWIHINLDGLIKDLDKNVYGQELAVSTILQKLDFHYSGKHRRRRPLVLSFHGSPGTGKNYVGSFIMENMFKIGSKSEFVHFYSGPLNFPVEKSVWFYQRQLKQDLEEKLKDCHRSVFIFDEIEKMPQGILDVLYPFMKGHAHVEDVDYSQALFILMSNIGQQEINDLAGEMWKRGLKRNEYELEKFETAIKSAAYAGKGGLHKSDLIKINLIDAYIPFLPLEKEHVIKCIIRDVTKMNQEISEELIKRVMDEMIFIDKFSMSGCKNADNIVKMLIFYQQLKNSKL